MRLLHASTYEFREFFDEELPPYAILSHRWGKREDEMTYQEWVSGYRKNCSGLKKIQQCCALALQDKLLWVWVDTCSIDKTSSAELTESINSMFQWYSQATRCYAYLADVNWPYELAEKRTGGIEDTSTTKVGRYGTFRKSEWFKRGWTLQELLAPRTVLFYDHDWDFLGSKDTLADEVSQITLIQIPCLNSSRALNAASVASKMSWVSKRKTTRTEDLAYCLLGIFGVNMPLLYGEKDKAFYRLQLEIVKFSNDESIFAWTSNDSFSGMLASHPSKFIDSGDVVIHEEMPRPPYTVTNRGLEFPVPTSKNSPIHKPVPRIRGTFLAIGDPYIPLTLNCRRISQQRPLVIELRPKGGDWVRSKCSTLQAHKSGTSEHTTVLGPKNRTGIDMARIYIIDTMRLQQLQWREENLEATLVPKSSDIDEQI